MRVNYPNHSLKVGDYFTIQNVLAKSFSLINSFILINNIKYMVIYSKDNQIIDTPSDYKTFVDELYLNIELIGDQIENKLINNIKD